MKILIFLFSGIVRSAIKMASTFVLKKEDQKIASILKVVFGFGPEICVHKLELHMSQVRMS